MPTNFPTSVDNFTNPTANDSLNLPSHSTQHANANDAIEAVEDYLLNGAGKTGLVLLKTQTIGTAVSSIAVTNVFSATYENYVIQIAGSTGASGGSNCQISFNNSTSTTYQWAGNYTTYGAVNTFHSGSTVSACQITLTGTSATTNCTTQVLRPFATSLTTVNSQYSTSQYTGVYGGYDSNSASHTGFNIVTTTTLTGGTIYVYGYRTA